MGCDIHIAVEERIAEGWWTPVRLCGPIKIRKNECSPIGYAAPEIAGRNYNFFAALAGVRGDGPQPRGLPEDINPATRHWLAKMGDHTPSWLPIAEFCALYLKHRRLTPGDTEDIKYPASEFFYLDEADDNPERFRVVFNFDS
jgi:hypothetical protein